MRKKSSGPFAIIAIAILGFCGICGKCGLNRSNVDVSTQTTLQNKLRSPANSSDGNSDNSAFSPPKSLIQAPQTKPQGKTAVVISETAEVRKTAGSGGEVIETLSAQQTVDVIKQKGAWFYVASDRSRGWLHGNTIRMTAEKPGSATESARIPPTVREVRSTKVGESKTDNEINRSGATAKCNDGTLSYSAHRRGTCSHHGGVAVWY